MSVHFKFHSQISVPSSSILLDCRVSIGCKDHLGRDFAPLELLAWWKLHYYQCAGLQYVVSDGAYSEEGGLGAQILEVWKTD